MRTKTLQRAKKSTNRHSLFAMQQMKRKHSEETKERIRLSALGRKCSDETKKKLRLFNLGRKHSEETKEKMRVSHHARLPAVEAMRKQKIQDYQKTRVLPPDLGRKISEAKRGKKFTEQHKQALVHARALLSPEQKRKWRELQAQALRGRKTPECVCEKMREAHKNQITNGTLGWCAGWYLSLKNDCKIPYQSSYELALYRILDSANNVKAWKRGPHVSYEFKGRAHYYFVDVEIDFIFGQSALVEVKPYQFLDTPKNCTKWRAAFLFARQASKQFGVVTQRELGIDEHKNKLDGHKEFLQRLSTGRIEVWNEGKDKKSGTDKSE